MSRVVPTGRIQNDKVDSSEDAGSSYAKEEISHQDHEEQTNKRPLSFLLPLPLLHSSSPACSPSDQVYLQASAIFQQLREEKPVPLQHLHYGKKTGPPLAESGDKPTQRRAYQLAFDTLKYQDLLEDIITDSCFHISQHVSVDLLPLAMVMLFDLQDRRFLLRQRSTRTGDDPLEEVRDLERSLHRSKTKLAASLARCRVKRNLQSFSCFLSDPVRTKQHRAEHLPRYAWVNTLKTSVEEVCDALLGAGLCEGTNVTDLKDSTFCRDSLCPDALVFSQQLHAHLQLSGLATTHVLNTQDRSVCLAVSALRPLLFDNGDVLVVGSFSALTVAHIAVVATSRSGRVLVCGSDHTLSQVQEIQELLKEMDIKNVRVLSEAFCSLNEWDATVQRLKVITVLPLCSSSALNDPVPTLHSEHGNWDVLPDLCHGSVSQRKIHKMASQQARLLAHALAFPKVQTVIYCTRSVYPEENEQLVKRVLEKTHTHHKLLPFRVNGPVFPEDSVQSGRDATTDPKFFRLEPSRVTNGCFIARLSRQMDPTKVETVQDVLARAAAKGLLGGMIPEQLKTGKKGKSKKNLEERQAAGGELSDEPGPLAASDREEEKGDGDVKVAEEEEEFNEEEEGEGKKVKGRKRKLKQPPKQVSKHPPKNSKKKEAKRRVNPSHLNNRRLTKSKQRRIPRLTLTLMSSAEPSSHLSPITALANRLSETPLIKSQHAASGEVPSSAGKHPSPARTAPPTPPAAPKRAARRRAPPEGEDVRRRDRDEPVGPSKARGATKAPSASAFPPIPSPSSGRSRRSVSQRVHMSTSSSSVSLPGL